MLIQVSAYVTQTRPKYGDQQTSLAIAPKKIQEYQNFVSSIMHVIYALKRIGTQNKQH